jgi:hypothetical protein
MFPRSSQQKAVSVAVPCAEQAPEPLHAHPVLKPGTLEQVEPATLFVHVAVPLQSWQAVQGTVVPTQTLPVAHLSVCVHRFPSSQAVPTVFGTRYQVPVVLLHRQVAHCSAGGGSPQVSPPQSGSSGLQAAAVAPPVSAGAAGVVVWSTSTVWARAASAPAAMEAAASPASTERLIGVLPARLAGHPRSRRASSGSGPRGAGFVTASRGS